MTEKPDFKKALSKLEVIVVRVLTFSAVSLVFFLLFIQQMATAQGNALGFYDVFGGMNIAGLMLAIPVTGGVVLQWWRLGLYKRNLLSGQTPDYFVTIFLMVLGLGIDGYVFIANPVFGAKVGFNLPRFVVFGWAAAHILQEIIDFLTTYFAGELPSQKRKEQDEGSRYSDAGFRGNNYSARERVDGQEQEEVRDTVRPKAR